MGVTEKDIPRLIKNMSKAEIRKIFLGADGEWEEIDTKLTDALMSCPECENVLDNQLFPVPFREQSIKFYIAHCSECEKSFIYRPKNGGEG